MKKDNTPTITSRRRPLSAHQRLRVETAKSLQKMGKQAKVKRAEPKSQPPPKGDSDMAASAPIAVPRAKKDTLATPTKVPSKFRKRQINKSWLPTHMYHAKRAHMTPPTEPLWRHAIPLTPNDKSYRATHRAVSARGCVAWDTSYMCTIAAEGVEASILGLLRGLGVEEGMLGGKVGSKWRKGSRGWEGWINERDGEKRKMARIAIIWDVSNSEVAEGVEREKEKRKILFRVHPSAFFQVWNEILKVAKIQRPPITVEDLRFEIGSIEVTGPGSTEALISALRPLIAEGKIATDGTEDKSGYKPEEIWPLLCEVANPASLPPNAILGFEINDPRLHHPPRTVKSTISSEALLQLLSTWPPDATLTNLAIFDRTARLAACRLLSSQKAINRRKGGALPGEYPDSLPQDPRIPVLLAASRAPSRGCQGTWTVLLPWKTVLPVWNSLMHYPLSTGENPRFGCLQEQRQVAFEQGVAWFPGDFPGTKAGWEWELEERIKRKAEWEKRPQGKRIAWESIDLGSGEKGEVGIGWACDWEHLLQGATLPSANPTDPASTKDDTAPTTSAPQDTCHQDPPSPPLSIHHVPSPFPTNSAASTALTTISLSLIARGAPTTCARIYRLPTTNPTLRNAWLAQIPTSKLKEFPPRYNDHHLSQASLPKDTPSHIRIQKLAAGLLAAPSPTPPKPQANDAVYPHVPGEEDLIGFVTTGNFDLGQGRARAIGCVALARVEGSELNQGKGGSRRLCIVRESGHSIGRLARWEFI